MRPFSAMNSAAGELRPEALRAYRDIGATGHVLRLTTELEA
jgi:hypothetical protein